MEYSKEIGTRGREMAEIDVKIAQSKGVCSVLFNVIGYPIVLKQSAISMDRNR